jgi:hypothetical protein
MQVLLNTDYQKGVVIEGPAAIQLLQALEGGLQVTWTGYGSTRVFKPAENPEAPFEFGTFKVVEDEAVHVAIEALRKQNLDLSKATMAARKEKRELDERVRCLESQLRPPCDKKEVSDGSD